MRHRFVRRYRQIWKPTQWPRTEGPSLCAARIVWRTSLSELSTDAEASSQPQWYCPRDGIFGAVCVPSDFGGERRN